VQSENFRQERGEFLGPQIGSELAAEAAHGDLNLAINPVAIQMVEQAWMAPGKRPNQHMMRVRVADEDVGARCHSYPRLLGTA
jgi:hypothetical protein